MNQLDTPEHILCQQEAGIRQVDFSVAILSFRLLASANFCSKE